MWFWWLFIGLLAIGGISTVTSIGEPREPISPGFAAAVVALDGLLIWGIAYYGLIAR